MTPVEIMALIIAVVAAIKIIVILVNPKSWLIIVNKVWSKPGLMMIVSLILAAITLYYLLQEFTIVDIFAAMLFISLLAAIGIAVYYKEALPVVQKLLKDKTIIKKSWLYILIWIILIIWVLKELLM